MKNKNGFISTSIMISFFMVFILISTLVLASYTHYRYLLQGLNSSILSDLNEVIDSKYVTLKNIVKDGSFENYNNNNSDWTFEGDYIKVKNQSEADYLTSFDGDYSVVFGYNVSNDIKDFNSLLKQKISIKKKGKRYYYFSYKIDRNTDVSDVCSNSSTKYNQKRYNIFANGVNNNGEDYNIISVDSSKHNTFNGSCDMFNGGKTCNNTVNDDCYVKYEDYSGQCYYYKKDKYSGNVNELKEDLLTSADTYYSSDKDHGCYYIISNEKYTGYNVSKYYYYNRYENGSTFLNNYDFGDDIESKFYVKDYISKNGYGNRFYRQCPKSYERSSSNPQRSSCDPTFKGQTENICSEFIEEFELSNGKYAHRYCKLDKEGEKEDVCVKNEYRVDVITYSKSPCSLSNEKNYGISLSNSEKEIDLSMPQYYRFVNPTSYQALIPYTSNAAYQFYGGGSAWHTYASIIEIENPTEFDLSFSLTQFRSAGYNFLDDIMLVDVTDLIKNENSKKKVIDYLSSKDYFSDKYVVKKSDLE